jgi:hypothetical protein
MIQHGLPFRDYLAIDAVSQSLLKVVGSRSPAAAKWEREHPSDPTPAMVLGQLVDAMAMPVQPIEEIFKIAGEHHNTACETCGAEPGCPCVSVAKGKAGQVLKKAHDGRTNLPGTVSEEQVSRARQMADELLNHPTAGPIIQRSVHQASVLWEDRATGLLCKGRPDLLDYDEMTIWDVKSCGDGLAHGSRWPQHVLRMRYYIQPPFYIDGMEANQECFLRFGWLCVESKHPFHVAVWRTDAGWIRKGRREYKEALGTYAWCREVDEWSGYPTDPQLCEMPRYAENEEDDRG